jgi:hypothetical protein
MKGELRPIGSYNLGLDRYEYFRCDDCATDYPVIDGAPRCNGQALDRCPYCRDDNDAQRDV